MIPHRLPSNNQIPWETILHSKSKYFNDYIPFEQKSVIYCFITKVYSKMKNKNKNIVVGIAALDFEPEFHCYL